jgi:hypothetical protein
MSSTAVSIRKPTRSARPGLRAKIATTVASNLQSVEAAIRAGKSAEDIAADLGINSAYASRIVTQVPVALPNLPKALPNALPWSDEDDALLLRERNENGTKWAYLAWIFERSVNELSLRYNYLSRLDVKREDLGDRIPMDCMTCRGPFISVNKVTNRRCEKCNSDSDGLPDGFICVGAGSGRVPHSAHAE